MHHPLITLDLIIVSQVELLEVMVLILTITPEVGVLSIGLMLLIRNIQSISVAIRHLAKLNYASQSLMVIGLGKMKMPKRVLAKMLVQVCGELWEVANQPHTMKELDSTRMSHG